MVICSLFIAYIDSSGRPFGDPENYVLSSVITNEAQWQNIDNSVKQLKLKHFPNLPDDEVEIHAKDMVNHDGIFQQMSWDCIYSIFDDVFNLISSIDNELRIIGVLIDKDRLQKSIDNEEWAYRLLFERINRFIKRQNQSLMEAQHPPQYGIMIMDSEGTYKGPKTQKEVSDHS